MEEADIIKLDREFWEQRAKNKVRIKEIFDQVAADYTSKEVAIVSIYDDSRLQGDVHAFIRLVVHPNTVVHVQGYPGFSTEEQINLLARVMIYDKMIDIRSFGPSIGNEHGAVVKQLLNQQFISYSAQDLKKLIEDKIPQLKL